MARVLVIDDEPDVVLVLRRLLERAGHEVDAAGDGASGLRAFFGRPSDVVVLDVGMPEVDGWQTLERLRTVSEVPVLMLTARGLELDKVRGLRAGADDYQTKPFSNPELLARVEALARRAPAPPPPDRYADGRLTVDFAAHTVTVEAHEVALSALEFRLLGALVQNVGQVVSHTRLLELAWRDPAGASKDQVKTYVRYVRNKLGWGGDGPLESVRGVGYRYRKP